MGRVCEWFLFNAFRRRQERVTSTVFAGVIVLFTDDQTLLTIIGWVLAWLCGAAVVAVPLVLAARRFFGQAVWPQSALFRETTDERLRPGELIPLRCPIRSASFSVCSQPPDVFRGQAGSGLHGWQSDGR